MIENLTGKAREKFSHWSSRTHKFGMELIGSSYFLNSEVIINPNNTHEQNVDEYLKSKTKKMA